MKYHILGIEKCGTTSLEALLKMQCHTVVRHEWAYCFKGVKTWHDRYYSEYIPTFITRDPVDRCYSDYNYAIKQKQIPKISYEEALEKHPRFTQGSNYEKWIAQFKDNCKIFNLDEMKMQILNKNTYPEITTAQRILTFDMISKSRENLYYRDDLNLEEYAH